MAKPKQQPNQSDRPGKSVTGQDNRLAADPVHNPPAPESSNRDHPDNAGTRTTAPGAGIISTGHAEANTGAHGIEHHNRDARNRPAGHVPQAAPGALRPGTTDSGRPAAVPAYDGSTESASSQAAEVASVGGAAAYAPGVAAPSESAGAAAPETNDPNYSAAHMGNDKTRAAASFTRMDTTGRTGQVETTRGTRTPRVVRDVMTADIEVCNPNTEVYYVARMMMERDVGSIPVVESTDTMRLVGILTDRDIVTRSIARNHNPLHQRAGDCMTTDPVTVRTDMPLKECVKTMERHQLRRVMVVDDRGRCCGIVAQADVVSTANEHVAAELVAEISEPTHQAQPPT